MNELTDHSDNTMAWREEKRLDYLERIALALEAMVDSQQTRPIIQQFLQTNVEHIQCLEHKGKYVKGELQTRCIRLRDHDEFHIDKEGNRWDEELVATGEICGNDDPDFVRMSGPCVRIKGHPADHPHGGHRDKSGGEW